jgi:polysaccharide biosynthesis protein PslH
MRILFLSSWFPYPPDNGSKLRVYNLLRALGRDHEVTLISLAFDTARPGERSDLATACTDVKVVEINPFSANQAGVFRTFLSTVPVASRPLPVMTRLVDEMLELASYDAVIASTLVMGPYALQVPRGTTTILEEHNSLTGWLRERYLREVRHLQRARYFASWKKHRHYEARYFRNFDLITMVSEKDRVTALETVGPNRTQVEVVPNGVDCRHNYLGLAPVRPNTLVYNGALTYRANYDAMAYFLQEVFPLVKGAIGDVHLTVTGSTQGVSLQQLSLDKHVFLSGYVDDVRPLVAQASVCIVPLREGGGTRLKILEAMALGTPVVSTCKGIEGLDVVDGEHVLVADEPEHFAACTVELLRTPALRKRLVENARALVEQQYDWEPIGRRFVTLVEDVVRERALFAS